MDASWTSVPNAVFAHLSSFTESELRVLLVVARHTWGWQKHRDRISLTQFQQETGMSRQGVVNGVAGLVKSGWLKAHDVLGSKEYEIVVDPSQRSGLVNVVDQSGLLSRPVVVNEVDQSSQPSRHTKERYKRKVQKEKKVRPAEPAAPNYKKYFGQIAEACNMDAKVPAFAKRISVAAKFVASREGDDLVTAFVQWWRTQDWRGKKGDLPKPENFVNEWPQFAGRKPATGRQARPVLEDEIAAAEAEARRLLDE
jgi:hypothetical protein